MLIHEALRLQRGDVVTFTGAGGKTSTLLHVGHELAKLGWRVVATTTTRVAADELTLMPASLNVSGASLRPVAVSRLLNQHQIVFLYHHIAHDKAIGLTPETVDSLIDSIDSDVILVEGDGSRRQPLKAPYEHEPVVPRSTTLMVPVVGVDAVGLPLDSDSVYNPESMMEHFGYHHGDRIKWPWVASVLRDPDLGLKGAPPRARVMALVNKVPPSGLKRNIARLIARLALREPRLHSAMIGAVQDENPIFEVHQRIAAIILAGGLSRRMGQPDNSKVLLPWDGRPIIRVIVDRLKRMRLDDMVVVTGHLAPKVRMALDQEPVRIAHNPNYREGDMLSSLQTGLRHMGAEIAACLVVLGDQPQLDNRVVSKLMIAYAEGKGKIVAPSYGQRRGHPILIDRCYWDELLALPPGGLPRDVINAHADQTAYVKVETDSVLRDIDTPDDYQNERRRAGLT